MFQHWQFVFLAAWSLIGQRPGQYNSLGRSDRKRCPAVKSSWPSHHVDDGLSYRILQGGFKPLKVFHGNQIPTGLASGSDRLVR